jgi:hypothetical protein
MQLVAPHFSLRGSYSIDTVGDNEALDIIRHISFFIGFASFVDTIDALLSRQFRNPPYVRLSCLSCFQSSMPAIGIFFPHSFGEETGHRYARQFYSTYDLSCKQPVMILRA